jgi:hypothetical protein
VRWFIGSDDSGHEYLVPLERVEEWHKFCAIPEDDEESWDVPAWAVRIDGGRLTFSEPAIGGRPVRP